MSNDQALGGQAVFFMLREAPNQLAPASQNAISRERRRQGEERASGSSSPRRFERAGPFSANLLGNEAPLRHLLKFSAVFFFSGVAISRKAVLGEITMPPVFFPAGERAQIKISALGHSPFRP